MNLDALSLPFLLGIFTVAAVAIWIAGIHLSDTTDILSTRFGLGEALGGMIILAIVTNLPEIAIVIVPDGQEKQLGHSKNKKVDDAKKKSTGKTLTIFLVCALVTLVAGVALERSGDAISTKIGMQGVLFGATVLAAATSLPEIS